MRQVSESAVCSVRCADVFGSRRVCAGARVVQASAVYLRNLYRNAGDPHYAYTEEEVAAYQPLPEFAEVLAGLQGRALQRAWELAKLVHRERHDVAK